MLIFYAHFTKNTISLLIPTIFSLIIPTGITVLLESRIHSEEVIKISLKISSVLSISKILYLNHTDESKCETCNNNFKANMDFNLIYLSIWKCTNNTINICTYLLHMWSLIHGILCNWKYLKDVTSRAILFN